MTTTHLPYWRRSLSARLLATLLAMTPGLVLHSLWLDSQLPMRLLIALTSSVLTALVLTRSSTAMRWPWVLEAAITAVLISALWPNQLSVVYAALSAVAGLTAHYLLGGRCLSPLSPAVLSVALGLALASLIAKNTITPPVALLLDSALVASAWLIGAVLLAALNIINFRGLIGFLIPTLLVWFSGDVPAAALIVAILLAGFVIADHHFLPITQSGQWLLGGIAGLATALLWAIHAAPISAIWVVLLAGLLSPWLEERSLPAIGQAQNSHETR